MQPDSLPPDVIKALKLGRPVEAIKRLRKATGMGLAEAKAMVDAFSSGNTAYQPPSSKKGAPRDRAGFESPGPQAVHPHQYAAPPTQPMPSRAGLGQGEVPNSNAAFWWVLLLAIVAVVGYLVLD